MPAPVILGIILNLMRWTKKAIDWYEEMPDARADVIEHLETVRNRVEEAGRRVAAYVPKEV